MRSTRFIRFISLILAAACAISLVSCGDDDGKGTANTQIKRKDYTFYEYFDTISTVYDYSGTTDVEFREICASLKSLTEKYHKLFDIYNKYDGVKNIAYLNSMAGKGAVKVDAELIDFLEYSKKMYEKTDGYVNIAMGAVLSLWHEARTNGIYNPSEAELPDSAALFEAAKHCNIDDLIIDRENMTVELRDPKMSLDVGAIAKGYSVERLADWLKANGHVGFALDIGGNLRVVGTKPDGSGWKTGVQNPFSPDGYVHTFELKDGSAVTSGGYERYFVVDGVKYHHIIDKDTMMPADHFSSVSVVCEDSALADALSTALFCMDFDAGAAVASSLGVRNVVWVMKDGSIKTLK